MLRDMAKEKTPAEAKWYEEREKWIEYLSTHPDISHATFRVAYFIAKRSNYEYLGMFWSVADIAKQVGCSTKTVSDASAQLSKMGLLKVRQTKGQNNFYAPVFFHM